MKIKVCSICMKASCSGRQFKTPILYGHGQKLGESIVCISDENVSEKDGKFYYRLIHGFGDSSTYPLKEIK